MIGQSLSRSILVLAVLVGGVLPIGCTTGSSSETAADSTAAPTTTTVSQTPAPDAAAATEVEKNDTRSLEKKLQDATVEAKVKRALMRESSLSVFPFRPNVVNGHLVLRGDVNTPDQYQRAERIAGRVEGIEAVTNRLTMGGRPVTEERLSSTSERQQEETTAVYHTVRQGDTLWDIARQYGASIQQIKNLNDLRSNNLRPGQRIRVR